MGKAAREGGGQICSKGSGSELAGSERGSEPPAAVTERDDLLSRVDRRRQHGPVLSLSAPMVGVLEADQTHHVHLEPQVLGPRALDVPVGELADDHAVQQDVQVDP